jgi:hypothetical protein
MSVSCTSQRCMQMFFPRPCYRKSKIRRYRWILRTSKAYYMYFVYDLSKFSRRMHRSSCVIIWVYVLAVVNCWHAYSFFCENVWWSLTSMAILINPWRLLFQKCPCWVWAVWLLANFKSNWWKKKSHSNTWHGICYFRKARWLLANLKSKPGKN